MPATFHIFPRRGLVVVHYSGRVKLDETIALFAEYARHPDYRPGQKQLVDLAEVTGFDNDFPALMKVQAHKAEVFLAGGAQVLLAYHAPTPSAYEMAKLARRSWEGLNGLVVRVLESEAETLEFLGQPERSLGELMARAG